MTSHNRRSFDVDIDVAPKTDKSKFGTRAMIHADDNVLVHPSGYYLEDVPVDGQTGWCAFDVEWGDEHGAMKVDLLTNTTYDAFKDKKHLLRCMELEPNWALLEDESFVATLPHIGKHFDIIRKIKPQSIGELADALALIRPGKVHLLDRYLEDKERARKALYKRSNQAYFKKSHSYSYASMIVAIMNLKKPVAVIW